MFDAPQLEPRQLRRTKGPPKRRLCARAKDGYSVAGVAGTDCSFGVLGPLVFERDHEAVPLPSGRQRSLLALLLLGGGVPLSRDRLIDELWGERPPASAVSALHVHLSKLRALLGGLLVLEPAGYALSAGDFELDVWRFEALVERARAAPTGASELLAQALALFRGEPLSDVACEGSIAQWRRTLEEKRLQTLVLRIDAELEAGAGGELVAELELLTAEHQFEERLWGQLMLALYRAGRQADALDAYQRARRLLAEQLGLDPGEPLVRLQRQILEGDSTLRALQAAPAVARSPASNLPRPLTRLVGRERELEYLHGLTADPDVRMVSLTGPGGVGKTRLLLELARRQESEYADGAVFVRLEQLTDPALVAAEIASALALRDGEGPNADGLTAYLRERELLLVIDNFEHLLSAAVLVAELLAQAPKIRVLASSRTALRIRGERVVEVAPLELPIDDDEAELARSPAVQLFMESALATGRRVEIDAATTRTVATICRALDGLPLAIELAAARSQSLSPAQIADQLAQPLSIGARALRDLPERQQTLQATISWSYELLGDDAQELLRHAAVFLGGFTEPALGAIAGHAPRAALDELLEASLVRRQLVEGRFELLELVRAFALERLESGAERERARDRHRDYFVRSVDGASEAFDEGAAPGEIAAPLLADHANLRAALAAALGAGDESSAVALTLGMRPLWLAGMLRQECQEFVDRVLEHFRLPGAQQVALLRAAAFLDGFPAGDGSWNRRLADCAGEIGDPEALAMATGNLFGRALNARDRDAMRRLRPDLLALVGPETGDKALGWTHYFLALDAYVDGQFEPACDHATLSAEKAEAIGHEFMLASSVGTRLLAQSARDGEIAHADLAEALELMRRPSVAPLAAFALWLVARYAAAVAPEDAGRWLAHAERILLALDSQLWPESVLRDETMEVLGLDDLAGVLETTPELDHIVAMTEATAWLAQRAGDERATRAARTFAVTP